MAEPAGRVVVVQNEPFIHYAETLSSRISSRPRLLRNSSRPSRSICTSEYVRHAGEVVLEKLAAGG